MKTITIIIALIVFSVPGFSQQSDSTLADSTNTTIVKPDTKSDYGKLFGTDLNPSAETVILADLIADPSKFEGKTINIKGDIADVCQQAGCWTYITDGTNYLLVQTLHKFFLPKDAAGKIYADGVFKQKEFTEEHAKEMLKESKNPRMKEEDIKGPQKVFVLEATGIKVYSK
ncbi:MAG: DUF4920 domain-containing protein [Ignavibacteria bacterium]